MTAKLSKKKCKYDFFLVKYSLLEYVMIPYIKPGPLATRADLAVDTLPGLGIWCVVCSMKCAVCSMHCTLCSVQCTLRSV